jgi:hypothetical protein
MKLVDFTKVGLEATPFMRNDCANLKDLLHYGRRTTNLDTVLCDTWSNGFERGL